MIHRLGDMIGSRFNMVAYKDTVVMAVPEPFRGGFLDRLRDAWSVLTRKSYAVQWPYQGEFEVAYLNYLRY
jgi:hypothetical protein